MKTLTIEHLKGYLGTDLQGEIQYDKADNEICTLSIKDGLNNECSINSFLSGTYQIKPLLYPLSTLTKFREDLGFVPMEKFTEDIKDDLSACIRDVTYHEMLYTFVINSLYQWHFDIHGLIEQGLAIDKTKKN